MNKKPLIGLVTVLYNSKDVLSGFFNSVKCQTFTNMRLYVIDNSPDEISLNIAKELSNALDIPTSFSSNRKNPGIATGNNQGIKMALSDKCDYILLLNNDIEFSKDTIFKMIDRALETDESIIAPKILYHGTIDPIIWYAGGSLSWLAGSNVHRGNLQKDQHQFDNEEFVTYSSTCFLLVKSKIFDDIGLMDDKYFIYYDDTDFVFRALKKYKILYYPNSVVFHKVGFSSGGISDDNLCVFLGRKSLRFSSNKFSKIGYLLFRNQAYYIFKNYSKLSRIIVLYFAFSKSLLGILIYDKSWLKRIKILITATRDGIKGRMGNPF